MFTPGTSGILHRAQSCIKRSYRQTEKPLVCPRSFIQSSVVLRESEFGRDEITTLSYSTHTHTEYNTTPKVSVYSPIGCWRSVVLVTPIVPKTTPSHAFSMTKQNTGSGSQCGETMGSQLQSAGRFMQRYLDVFCVSCNLLLSIGRCRDHFNSTRLSYI